jgi:hypothetical protein
VSKRMIAVVLGATALALPGTAVAGSGKDKPAEKVAKQEHKTKKGKKDKSSKAKKAVSFVFKGVYKGEGVVTVESGNAHAKKGGYVGKDVTFDLSSAKVVAAEFDNVAGLTAADLQAGDQVLVQARLPRGTKAPVAADAAEPAAIVARKVIDKTHPPVEDDAAPALEAAPAA